MYTFRTCPGAIQVAVIALSISGILAAVTPAVTNRTDGSPRIIGGFVALAASTQHQVSLRIKEYENIAFGRGHLCGGSLISQQHVLTAAHCLVDYGIPLPAEIYVVVGGNTARLVQTPNTFISDVRKVTIHPAYDDQLFVNDIGLLLLAKTVASDHPTLKPISLVEQTPPAGALCQVTGWGTTVSGVPGSAQHLMAVNITVIDMAVCNATGSYDGELAPGMLCAGFLEGGKDSCQGDSGGPLVCDGLLAGTVSFGNECGLENFPGVYADVAFYRDWIAETGNGASRQLSGASLLFSVLVSMLLAGGSVKSYLK